MIAITSQKRRRWYFVIFAVLFLVSIPIVTLYASGYRLDEKGNLVATGGIALSQVPRDAEVYFEYQPQKKASILNRDFFVQNLLPKEYLVVVAKPGYWSWAKRLTVKEKRVVYASVFMLPQQPKLIPLQEFIAEDTTEGVFSFFGDEATTTRKKNSLYAVIQGVFAQQVKMPIASSTPLLAGRVALWQEGAHFLASWRGADQDVPEFLCPTSPCVRKLPFFAPKSPATNLSYFPGREDVVLFTTKDGIYAVEIDQRSEQNLQPVFLESGADFRIHGGKVYIESKGQYFEFEL